MDGLNFLPPGIPNKAKARKRPRGGDLAEDSTRKTVETKLCRTKATNMQMNNDMGEWSLR